MESLLNSFHFCELLTLLTCAVVAIFLRFGAWENGGGFCVRLVYEQTANGFATVGSEPASWVP